MMPGEGERRPGGGGVQRSWTSPSVPDTPIVSCAVVVDLRDLPPHDAGHALERALSDLPQGADVVLQVNAEFWCTALPDVLRNARQIRLEASSASVVRSWRDALDQHIGRR